MLYSTVPAVRKLFEILLLCICFDAMLVHGRRKSRNPIHTRRGSMGTKSRKNIGARHQGMGIPAQDQRSGSSTKDRNDT